MDPSAFSFVGGTPHDNLPPYLVINFVIALEGIFPSQN
jgi:microcystin-dependent protein